MNAGRRAYIARAVLLYMVLALAWIFLSDQLLTVFVDITSLVWLSTAKGVFFVLVSGGCFAVALHAVPDTASSSFSSEHALLDTLTYRPKGRWLIYLFAIVLTAAMVLVRLLIPTSPGQLLLILFMLPIILASLFGGLGPGLAATATAAGLSLYFIVPPSHSFAIANHHDLFQLAFLLVNGLVVSLISEGIHRLRRRESDRLHLVETANEALRRSEERFRLLFNDAPVAMGHADHQGHILAQNSRFEQLFGYTLAEIPTLAEWWPLAYPDPIYRARARQQWKAVMEQSKGAADAVDAGSYRITAKNGNERMVRIYSIRMPGGLLTAFLDETEQRQAEARLRLWAESFEQAELGLVLSEARTNTIIAANPAFARRRGYRREEMVGMAVSRLFPADYLAEAQSILSRMSTTPHGVFETEHITADGQRFPVMIDVTVVAGQDGQPSHRIAYVLDITERKRAEQALAEALETQKRGRIAALNQMQDANLAREEIRRLNISLEQRVAERTAELSAANRELDSFAYAVSHDLRAPLRAMNGFAQALIEDCSDSLKGDGRLYLDQIIIASRKMGELIDGLLTLSRSTRSQLQREMVDLSKLAAQMLTTMAADEPDRQVRWTIEPNLRVHGDRTMIEVALGNLLANAWKYTSYRDEAVISLYSEERSGRHFLCIADNGAGFEPAHAAKLFQPFQRLHRQEEFPGIGIGLATVQRIIQRHGGTLTASGEKNHGATFAFSLPGDEEFKG